MAEVRGSYVSIDDCRWIWQMTVGLEVDDLRWVIGGFRWCVCMYMCVGGCIIIWVWVAANGCGWLKMGVLVTVCVVEVG